MINKFGVLFQLSKELNIIKFLEREKQRFLSQMRNCLSCMRTKKQSIFIKKSYKIICTEPTL